MHAETGRRWTCVEILVFCAENWESEMGVWRVMSQTKTPSASPMKKEREGVNVSLIDR